MLLLTPWCRVLLEKLTGLQLVKFPAFHGTRRFIIALTSVRHMSLSWASPIHSIYPHPTSWRSILILSTHLRLGLPSGFFLYGFHTKTLYTPLFSPYVSHVTLPNHKVQRLCICPQTGCADFSFSWYSSVTLHKRCCCITLICHALHFHIIFPSSVTIILSFDLYGIYR